MNVRVSHDGLAGDFVPAGERADERARDRWREISDRRCLVITGASSITHAEWGTIVNDIRALLTRRADG